MSSPILIYLANVFKKVQRGTISGYPDPADPSDLGSPLTQDEIDFIKRFRKEVSDRFIEPGCTVEKTGVSITNTTSGNFTTTWTEPSETTGTTVKYRQLGGTDWLVPNAVGNAVGHFTIDYTSFIFTSGLTTGTTYEVRVHNSCASNVSSAGVVVQAAVTFIS